MGLNDGIHNPSPIDGIDKFEIVMEHGGWIPC